MRADLNPVVVSETIVAAMFGTRLLCNAIAAKGLSGHREGGRVSCVNANTADRTNQFWELLLGGIATGDSLPYFREFLAREALRHSRPVASSPSDAIAVTKAI